MLRHAEIKMMKNRILGSTSVYLGGCFGPLGTSNSDGSRNVKTTEITATKIIVIIAHMKYISRTALKANPAAKMVGNVLLLAALMKSDVASGEKAIPVMLGYEPMPQ